MFPPATDRLTATVMLGAGPAWPSLRRAVRGAQLPACGQGDTVDRRVRRGRAWGTEGVAAWRRLRPGACMASCLP